MKDSVEFVQKQLRTALLGYVGKKTSKKQVDEIKRALTKSLQMITKTLFPKEKAVVKIRRRSKNSDILDVTVGPFSDENIFKRYK
jgi:hypothetical protein